MEAILLDILPSIYWQYLNAFACTFAGILCALMCLTSMDTDNPDYRRKVHMFGADVPLIALVHAMRFAAAFNACAFGIVTISAIEAITGYHSSHHMPSEILLNIALMFLLVTVAAFHGSKDKQ